MDLPNIEDMFMTIHKHREYDFENVLLMYNKVERKILFKLAAEVGDRWQHPFFINRLLSDTLENEDFYEVLYVLHQLDISLENYYKIMDSLYKISSHTLSVKSLIMKKALHFIKILIDLKIISKYDTIESIIDKLNDFACKVNKIPFITHSFHAVVCDKDFINYIFSENNEYDNDLIGIALLSIVHFDLKFSNWREIIKKVDICNEYAHKDKSLSSIFKTPIKNPSVMFDGKLDSKNCYFIKKNKIFIIIENKAYIFS